jgi:hypothetical protein
MEIPEIKAQLPLSGVLQHYGLKPDKHGRLHCPFHEDHTPGSVSKYLVLEERAKILMNRGPLRPLSYCRWGHYGK